MKKKGHIPKQIKPEIPAKIESLEKRLDGIEALIREALSVKSEFHGPGIQEILGAKTEHNTEAKPIVQSPVQSPSFSDTEGLYILTVKNLNDTALERFASYKWLLGKIVCLKDSAKEDVPILSWDEVRDAVAIVKVVVLKVTKLGIAIDIGVEFNFDLRTGNNLNGEGTPKRCLWISGDNYEVYE